MTPDELRQAQDLAVEAAAGRELMPTPVGPGQHAAAELRSRPAATEHADEIIRHEMLGRGTIDTDNRPSETYDRRLTAYNEAGHAVGAVLRRGTFVSITIEPTGDRDGCTNVEAGAYDMAFVAFSGVWAEARAQWGKPLDGEGHGSAFDYYLGCAFERNADGDLRDYLRHAVAGAAVFGANTWLAFASERRWSRELESKWPVIRDVAELLMAQADVSTEVVSALLG